MTTAIAVADALYPDGPPTKTVVIASGEAANWVDSVTVAPLASALKAPILLSASPTSLGDAVAAYLTGEGIQRVYLVGADANPTLARSLPPGIAVTPLSGSDRYATAAEIAQTLQQVTGTSGFGSLFIVDGGDRGLAQALAVDPYAASHGSPVLLAIPGQSTLPASEQAWVTRSTSQTLYLVGTAQGQGLATTYGSDQVVRIGTATATPDAVASAAAQLFAPSGGYTQVAIANADTTNGVALPDGNVVSAHLVDAIPGGPWAAATGAPILYVDGSQIPATTSTVINSALVSPTAKLWVFGGPNSIPDATANALAAMIANRTNAQQGPTSPPSLAISGQSFGSGSPTDPAVVSGNNPVTLTISNLPSPSTGTSTALWVAVNGQPAPTFSVGGQPLPTVSGPVNGGQNGLTAPLPPSSTGSLTVQMVPPPGSTAVYWLGLTSNGAPQASPLVLTFISNNTLAVVPGGTASSPYVAPVSSAANQTAGLVPLTVVVPPQGGSPAAGIPVTVTLLIPTAQSRPSSGPYLSDTQGGAVTTPTALAYTVSATTNGQGEATTYVNSTDVTTSPVEILATASDGTGTLSGSAYVTWQVPQATPPSSTGSSSGTPLTVTVTAAPGLSPQSLTATFATNGTVVATQALPLTAYNPASGAITVTVPATLPAGTYTVTVTLVTATGTFTSSSGSVTAGTPAPAAVTVSAAPGLSPQSLTATFATNGTVVATQALPLTAYNPASGAITVTVPATLPAGTYTVTVTLVTATGTFTSSSGSVTAGTPAPAAVTVSAAPGLSPQSLTATFATNGTVVGTQALPLSAYNPASGAITVTVPATLPAGTYTVTVTLVTATGTFTSSSGSITIGTPAPAAVTVSAAPGLSPQSLTATFATNGTVVATQALPLTAYNPASGAITVTVPATLPAGTYTVTVILVTATGTFTSSSGSITVGTAGLTGSNTSS